MQTVATVLIKSGRRYATNGIWNRVENIVFPLVDKDTFGSDQEGRYVRVDGTNLRGFPKRGFKVYYEEDTDIEVDGEVAISETTQNFNTEADYEARIEKESDEEIKARIATRFEVMEKLGRGAVNSSKVNSMIVSGPPGVGKSYSLVRVLESMYDPTRFAGAFSFQYPEDHDDESVQEAIASNPHYYNPQFTRVTGRVTAGGLYSLLYEFRHPGQVILLDDADVWGDEATINLLKAAMPLGGGREIHWQAMRIADDLPTSFLFQGTILFITNLDFDGLIKKNNKLSPHLDALMSRTYYIDLTMHTVREKMLRIEQVCLDGKMLEEMGLSHEEELRVMSFFKENVKNFRELSIRTVEKIANLCILSNGEDWEALALVTLTR